MATFDPDPFPDPFYVGFLNQPHVQAAMGVPLNWTQSSGTVSDAFRSIGDYVRPGWIDDLAYLLENGIKVTLAYGGQYFEHGKYSYDEKFTYISIDRDYACNWIGGEVLSKAINYTDSVAFRNAGYAEIQANDSYVGGLVRQVGNLSFSRVFEAGHEIPSYQPETAYRIFMRALFNMDIATGEEPTYSDGVPYKSEGPADTLDYRNELPEQPVHFCYVLDPTTLCSEDQIASLLDGTAEIQNYIVVDSNSTELFPDVVGGSNTAEESGGASTSSGASTTSGGGPTSTSEGGAASTSQGVNISGGRGGGGAVPPSEVGAGSTLKPSSMLLVALVALVLVL